MARRIIYHPKAAAELDRLHAALVLHAGEGIAGDFVEGLLTFIENLETFPERGSLREGNIAGLRIIGYRRSVSVAFVVRADEVVILGVFHRGRNITQDLLGERL